MANVGSVDNVASVSKVASVPASVAASEPASRETCVVEKLIKQLVYCHYSSSMVQFMPILLGA